MTDQRFVRVERIDGVALVRLDRPPANALELESVADLAETFTILEKDDDVRAVVLTGTAGFFSGGLDLKAIPAYSVERQRAMVMAINQLVARLYAFRFP